MIQIEDDILTRCQGGDKTAFRWVVQTYQRMLFSLALKMLADEEEAKDVVQDTFVRAWTAIRRYNPQQPFASWLYTIASRLCLNRLKAVKKVAALPEDMTVLRQFASDDDNQRILENSEWVAIVRILAEGLSEKQRLVFTLCQLEGLSSEEAEQITGMDARQIKSNLYVARQTIRKRLKDLGYEED
ncbi:RNA polymerase sigma factor [uncultured Prevotella sp.]|uniref:RNA polymerase sigma factor n=1 Tax=uncultured Prevotella sp. TaxID=159272 RepID=UPI00258AD0E0|nr:RNA polymerase sigma factor [uncultured Prevotella sp.]